jgi:cobalt-zinc-cadmium efflux system outer membrane protein
MWNAVFRVACRSALVGFLVSNARSETIDLARAIELAGLTHPSLKAGAARNAAAAGRILTARAHPNPEVALLSGAQYSQPVGGRRFNVPVFTFSQPLEFWQLRPARIDLAKRGLDSSERALAEIRLAILSNVRFTFYEVLRREGETVIADEALRLAQDLRDRIRVRVQVGEVGRLELVRAEAEVASARSVAANGRIQRLAALAAFRAALGGEVPPGLEPAGALDAPSALPPLDSLRQEVIDRHPSLAFLKAEVTRANAQLTYQKSLRRPQPQFRGELDNTNPSYRFGIAIELPAWNRRVGEVATAEAYAREARYLAEVRRTELLAALESAFGRFQVSTQEVEALEQGLMREANEAVRAAETAYQLGERSILEVLDAQRVLRSVRLNLLNAQYDRQSAIIEIDALRAVIPGVTP